MRGAQGKKDDKDEEERNKAKTNRPSKVDGPTLQWRSRMALYHGAASRRSRGAPPHTSHLSAPPSLQSNDTVPKVEAFRGCSSGIQETTTDTEV